MRPTSIFRRVKPPKIARFARRAGCEAGFGRSSSVCSAMIGFPFRQCRGYDFLAPQDDQSGRNDEMRGDKEVLEGRDPLRGRADIAARQVGQLLHTPVEGEAATGGKEKREPNPGP